MHVEPQEEHRWLDRLVGEWTYEFEAPAEPGGPPSRYTGTETVRSVGGVWVVCEGSGDMPAPSSTVMTLGYDPAQQRYVGTFIGSMMTHLWIYRGAVDAEGRLVLETEGPSFSGDGTLPKDGTLSKYEDVIEFLDDDHRVLVSRVEENGAWREIMRSQYRRVR